jgi:6-phosphogluconolactonase
MAPGLRKSLRRRLKPRLQIFPSLDALSTALAQAVVKVGRSSVEGRGRFSLVLNGGGTPEMLFAFLGKRPILDEAFWGATHVYWGDERSVPPDQEGSNFRQAQNAFLSRLDLDSRQVHRIRGELEPSAAAQAYCRELASMAEPGRAWPRFDLVLLGMGADGHTASLFPGADYSDVNQAALAVTADYEGRPAQRVTLTPPALNEARHIFFMAAGEKKSETLSRVLEGPRDPLRLPAQWIAPDRGDITWWLDEAISSGLAGGTR